MPIVFPLINSEWILSGLVEWPESINTAWIKDLNMDQVRYWRKLLRQGTPTLNSDLAFAGRHMSLGSRVNNPFVPLEGWTQKRKNTRDRQHEEFNEILVVCFFFPFMVLDLRVLETTKPGFLNPMEPWGESIYRLNLDDAPMPVPQKDEIGWLELKENHKKPWLFGPQNMDSNTLRL